MREIEASNRLYQEHGAHYMTTILVYNLEAHVPTTTAVTFILAGDRLVTVRYSEPKASPYSCSASKREMRRAARRRPS